MRWSLRLIVTVVGLASSAGAEELSFSRNARTFETQQGSLVTKGMAFSCLTVSSIPDGLPCNPAMTPRLEKPTMHAEILLSNGHASLSKVQKLLKGEVSQELVDSMFDDSRVLQIEGNAEIDFRSRRINARYTPYTIKGFAVFRNEADPDIELYAIEEQNFTFQSGYEAYDDFYLGLQTRFVQRKFIRQRFLLTDLATPAGKTLLEPKTQKVAYIEPGMTWYLAKAWRPRLAVMVANAGFYSARYDELPIPVEIQPGIGISPPLTWGELDLTVEYRGMNYEENSLEKLRAGALYPFGSMYMSGGVDVNGISGGVYYGLEHLNAGIMYSTTRFINEEESFYTQTVYVQLGWQI